MGFVGELLKDVNGVEWFYTAGILIFIVLFMLILYRTIRMPKSDLRKFKNSILDPEEIAGSDSKLNQPG